MSALNLGLSAATQQYLRVFDAAGSLIHHSNAAVMLTMDFISKAGVWRWICVKCAEHSLALAAGAVHPCPASLCVDRSRAFECVPLQASM